MEIEEFTSFDDLFRKLSAREDDALQHLTEKQKEVTWGDWWVRLYFSGEECVPLFGYCQTEEEAYDDEVRAGATSTEADMTSAILHDSHMRGYRYGPVWSMIVPESELGSTHVSQIVQRITKEQFDQAQGIGFEVGRLTRECQWFRDVIVQWMKGDKE